MAIKEKPHCTFFGNSGRSVPNPFIENLRKQENRNSTDIVGRMYAPEGCPRLSGNIRIFSISMSIISNGSQADSGKPALSFFPVIIKIQVPYFAVKVKIGV